MAFARSVKQLVRIKTFTLNSREEVLYKITREVLTLFRVEVTGKGDADYLQISIVNKRLSEKPVRVETRMILFDRDGEGRVYARCASGSDDEKPSGAVNRIIKLNLYHIFCEDLKMPVAPWGILHGVRPTKIVHRWIRAGMDEKSILSRLQREYECSEEKAGEIVPMAFRQLPFLRTSDERTVSIYIGIPFCLTRCLYCSFPSNVLPGEKKLRAFMEALHRDLVAACHDIEVYGLRVQNIYIGGGTPTSLPNNFFAEMLSMVYNAFYGDNVVEFTVEAGRPDSISEEKVAEMKRRHVTRVSVNPQSMRQRTLDLLGRRHTPEDVRRMFAVFRKAGAFHINMDVIIGLPGETSEDIAYTMGEIARLGPDDITLHALALKRGSRLMELMQERHVDLPAAEEARKMFRVAMQAATALGMQPYYLYRQGYMAGDLENVGLSKPGSEGMYNIQIMEEHQTIIGIGGAATSKVVNFRENRLRSSFHPKDLTTYLRDVDKYIARRHALLEKAYGVQ